MSGLYYFTAFLLSSVVWSQTIINNTLYEDQFACPDSEVIFTCEIQGFQILSWTSDVLIGSGGEQLQFSTTDPQNTRRNSRSNPTTFALLTVSSDGEMPRLVSELHVTVPLDISSASVTCTNVVNSTFTVKSFTVLGQPNVPQDLFASQVECNVINFTECRNTYYWHYNPKNATQAGISDYNIFLNGNLGYNCTLSRLTSSTETGISSLFCVQDCDTRMFSVSAVNICRREGQRSPDLILNPEERITLSPAVCVANAESGTAYQNGALTMLLMAVIIAMIFARG